jgi:hypothetical protein
MTDVVEKPSAAKVAELRKLRLEAMNLQAIEGNPLDAEDVAMFEREVGATSDVAPTSRP